MRIDGNRMLALPRLLDVSISFRLIVIALLLLFRGCIVPVLQVQPIGSWAESQIHRVFTTVHAELPTQGRRGGSRKNLKALVRRRVRRIARHSKVNIRSVAFHLLQLAVMWDPFSRPHQRDTFCTSGTSP
jgi:hypothetical protein